MLSNSPDPNARTVYVVAIDGTPSSSYVNEMSCGLAGALAGNAELHFVHVIDAAASADAMNMARSAPVLAGLETARRVLDRACTEARTRFEGVIAGHLAAGEPSRAIVQTASNLRADLVIVGTAGRTGIARVMLGSVAEKVVRQAGCPVLVVRPKDHHAAAEPTVEPPCPDCVEVQTKTASAQLWCVRHATPHAHGRLHYELPPTFAVGSMNFRP